MKDLVEIAEDDIRQKVVKLHQNLMEFEEYLENTYGISGNLFRYNIPERRNKFGLAGVRGSLCDFESDLLKVIESYKRE